VVTKFVGNEAANDLARDVGYPDGRSGSSPEIPVNHLATSDAALFVLDAAYGWGKPSMGVALHSLHGRLDHPFSLRGWRLRQVRMSAAYYLLAVGIRFWA
jgi:hypothetical protein